MITMHTPIHTHIHTHTYGGAHDLMVIVVENGHSDPGSNPRWSCLHFTLCYPGEMYRSNSYPFSYG